MIDRPDDEAGSAKPRPDEKTEVVFRTWNDTEAALVAGLLRAAGIPCSTVSDIPHSVVPVTLNGLGEVRIIVSHEDAARAAELIASRPLDDSPEDARIASEEPSPEEG